MLSIVGYELCPAEMMASNPLWCKSEWKEQYTTWIHSPGEKGILMCSILIIMTFMGIKLVSETVF
jgi:CBS domain-containing protein